MPLCTYMSATYLSNLQTREGVLPPAAAAAAAASTKTMTFRFWRTQKSSREIIRTYYYFYYFALSTRRPKQQLYSFLFLEEERGRGVIEIQLGRSGA